LCEILTDLAYIYDAECEEPDKAISLLEQTMRLGTPFINTYYALGTLYLDVDIDKAEQMFLKASESDPQNIEYSYHLGYCLLNTNKFEQALSLFEPVAKNRTDSNELAEQASYCCALALVLLGKKSGARKITDDLHLKYRSGKTIIIDVPELINLYYCLEEYQIINGLLEDESLDPKGNKYALYFSKEEIQIIIYSLHIQGYDEKCKAIFESKIEELKEIIENYQTDDTYTPDEINEIITLCEKEMAEIKESYVSITTQNKKPDASNIYQGLRAERRCYLIDCPRHYMRFKT
jgi:tetratricopeptide (TPR) repeat protein